jgi:hypothetical protein
MNVEAIIKEYERVRAEQHRDMVLRGMAAQASRGFLVGPPRFGYAVERTRKGSRPRLIPELAPFLRRAFDRVLEDYSTREIFDSLNAQGICGKRGNPISFSTVQRMLRDPYYAGLTKNGNGHLIRGIHEPLVDYATLFNVQQKLRVQMPKETFPPDVVGLEL